MVTRRDFLRSSGLVVAGLFAGPAYATMAEPSRKLPFRFGMVTDVHYADVAARGERHYRESLAKMSECIKLMNARKVEFLIELGDFKDQDEPVLEKNTLQYLKTIEKVFGKFKGPRYHVLGNHDMDSISKTQFQSRVRNTGINRESTYYSFDKKGLHLVVLDANYTAGGSDYDHGNFDWRDANIPAAELDWLRTDLESTALPVIVFVHQQLDGDDDHCVRNAEWIRQILQENNKVLAVFQGHKHSGQYSYIENIHYYTLKAMVTGSGEENNSYAIVDVYDDHSIMVTGYRRAESIRM
jgi:predicted phosphodiesterase